MIASMIYWTLRRLVELLVLRRRSDDGKAYTAETASADSSTNTSSPHEPKIDSPAPTGFGTRDGG